MVELIEEWQNENTMRNNSCGGNCVSLREAMMRGAAISDGFYGVTMLSDGKRARKSSAFRVIRPSLACARAPIMTSATGRRAALPDRLRWTCLFHAETAMERSSSLTPGGRSIPISNRKFRSRASSPRKAGASSKIFHPLCCGTRLPKSRGISKHCLGAFTLRLLHNRYYAGVRILSFVPEQVRPRSHLHILADLGGY